MPARGLGVGQIGAGVAAGVLVAAAAAWLLWPRPAPVQQLRVEVRLSTQELNGDLGPAFDVSPSGSHIAFVSGGQGERELRVRQLDQLDSTVLALRDNNGEPYHPFFSPDGEWVGFVTATEMRKVPAAGGTPLTITKVNRSRGASWGADGSIVFAPDPGSGLMRVPAAGGEPTPLTTLNAAVKEATHRWPQFLPGDKAVLFTSHTQSAGDFDNATIEVVDVATGARKVVQKGATFGRYIPTGHLLFVNKGTLFAVPFDVGSLTASGSPVPVVREVTSSPEGGAQVAFSTTGLLVYLRGAAKTPRFPVVWVDRQGGVTPLLDETGTYGNPRLSPDGKRLSMNVLRNGNWDIWVLDIERHVMSRLTFDEGTDTEQSLVARRPRAHLRIGTRGQADVPLPETGGWIGRGAPGRAIGFRHVADHMVTRRPRRFLREPEDLRRRRGDPGRQARVPVASRQSVCRNRSGLLARQPVDGVLVQRIGRAADLRPPVSLRHGPVADLGRRRRIPAVVA